MVHVDRLSRLTKLPSGLPSGITFPSGGPLGAAQNVSNGHSGIVHNIPVAAEINRIFTVAVHQGLGIGTVRAIIVRISAAEAGGAGGAGRGRGGAGGADAIAE